MKRGTESKVKFKLLRSALSLTTWQTKGLLQSLWDFAVENCPAGDIGRFTDAEIALGIDWTTDPAQLINALVSHKWLDKHPDCRLIVHDWHHHCEDIVHIQLAKQIMFFADGTMPKLTRLTKDERADITHKYAEKRFKTPALPCLALPIQAHPPAGEDAAWRTMVEGFERWKGRAFTSREADALNALVEEIDANRPIIDGSARSGVELVGLCISHLLTKGASVRDHIGYLQTVVANCRRDLRLPNENRDANPTTPGSALRGVAERINTGSVKAIRLNGALIPTQGKKATQNSTQGLFLDGKLVVPIVDAARLEVVA